MSGILKQLFGERTRVPRQSLPTDGWCQIEGVARMSLVWPWFAVLDPRPLVDDYGRDVGTTPGLELHAPRSDRDAVLCVWSEQGGGFVVGPEWASAVSRMYRSPVIQANVPFALGGCPGRMAQISSTGQTSWRIIIPRPNSVVHLDATVPSSHAEAYWAQLESMLATWGWDS